MKKRMMSVSENFKIGTSGYSYPGDPPKGWYGVFYPETRSKNLNELEYYSQFFDTVEINSTFYRPPSPAMSKAWAKKTPANFEFAVKVWQKFTHPKKIGEGVRGAEEKWEPAAQGDVDLFRTGIDPLVESRKLGILLLQYPPGFHCIEENIERLRWALKAFRDYPKVVELRHRSWSDRSREIKGLLEELGAGWAVIDEPKFASSVRQEFEPVGNIFYFRAHGRNVAKWWQHGEPWERYDYLYSQEQIHFFGDKIREVVKNFPGSKVYVFFNNHARGQAVANGIMLRHEMGMPIKTAPISALARAFPQISAILPAATQEGLF